MNQNAPSPYAVETSTASPPGEQPQAWGCMTLLLTPVLLAVAGFCSVGYLHSYEVPGVEGRPWRIVYGAITLGCLFIVGWLFRKVLTSGRSPTRPSSTDAPEKTL